jgi:hypothetical protein
MTGAQCDTCRKFSADPSGWLFLLRNTPVSFLSAISGESQAVLGTFCSAKCAADFAYVLAAAGSTEKAP